MSRVIAADMLLTPANPRASNVYAETAAATAIPSCEDAFRTAVYSPRISAPTISVEIACSGACRADAQILKTTMPIHSPQPHSSLATMMNTRARMRFDPGFCVH